MLVTHRGDALPQMIVVQKTWRCFMARESVEGSSTEALDQVINDIGGELGKHVLNKLGQLRLDGAGNVLVVFCRWLDMRDSDSLRGLFLDNATSLEGYADMCTLVEFAVEYMVQLG